LTKFLRNFVSIFLRYGMAALCSYTVTLQLAAVIAEAFASFIDILCGFLPELYKCHKILRIRKQMLLQYFYVPNCWLVSVGYFVTLTC